VTAASSLVVDIAELQRRDSGRGRLDKRDDPGTDNPDGASGEPAAVTRSVVLADAVIGDRSIVDGRVDTELVIEADAEKVVVRGTLRGAWRVPCRRCLSEVVAPLAVHFHETFEYDPTEGETWPIADERIDLTDPLRQAALLAIPLVPLCSPECRGPEPERFPTGADHAQASDDEPRGDPRWAALDALRLDD